MSASTESGKAVFLSYASEDAAAAERICAALRAAGVEVWFDKSELRGGDEWDGAIRQQIKACSLFLPVISRTTQARDEGYFRLEWKLAVDRSHLMAADRTFLLPILIDDIADPDARVPDRFREVQWTRLPGGETSAAFAQRVAKLLRPTAGGATSITADVAAATAAPTPAPAAVPGRAKVGLIAAVGLVLLALGVFAINRGIFAPRANDAAATPRAVAQGAPATDFNPPQHSIAVLPFANMSGDPRQDYFSDGLSEELLNSLVTIRDLQVAARTSSFSFKGKDTALGEIARQLNVGAILEGSVRREGSRVRITAQLINAVTGFNMWSETYDRDLRNVLALQTEIAVSVTKALQATLRPEAAATIELGGTRNAQAFDAYLRAQKFWRDGNDKKSFDGVIAAADEAIRLDPDFSKAYIVKALALSQYASNYSTPAEFGPLTARAIESAERAVALTPGLAQAHAGLGNVLTQALDLAKATAEVDRALALDPSDLDTLLTSGFLFAAVGKAEDGVNNVQRAAVLDPLNPGVYYNLGTTLNVARRFRESVAAFDHLLALSPGFAQASGWRGASLIGLGDLDGARKSCETPPISWRNRVCLAIVYQKQNDVVRAQANVDAMQAELGDSLAYQFAEIYAQWGDFPKALDWLQKAVQLHDPGLPRIRNDVLLDPLRKEARYQAIERGLNFPG